jgi:hypothetical protein
MPEFVWDGKYDKDGRRVAPLRVALPFQPVEAVNGPAQRRQLSMDRFLAGRDAEWRNETKGREDIDVAHKDRAARIWCENATLLIGAAWTYLKVSQREFEKLQPADFADLSVFAG